MATALFDHVGLPEFEGLWKDKKSEKTISSEDPIFSPIVNQILIASNTIFTIPNPNCDILILNYYDNPLTTKLSTNMTRNLVMVRAEH